MFACVRDTDVLMAGITSDSVGDIDVLVAGITSDSVGDADVLLVGITSDSVGDIDGVLGFAVIVDVYGVVTLLPHPQDPVLHIIQNAWITISMHFYILFYHNYYEVILFILVK